MVGLQFGFDVSFGTSAPESARRFAGLAIAIDRVRARHRNRSRRAGRSRRRRPPATRPRPVSRQREGCSNAASILTPLAARANRLKDESQSAIAGVRRDRGHRHALVARGHDPARRLTHEEIVRLLTNSRSADFVVTLLERAGRPPLDDCRARSEGEVVRDVLSSSRARREPVDGGPAHWIVTVGRDDGLPPEQFLQMVVGRRLLFGVPNDGALSVLRRGDRLCFHITGQRHRRPCGHPIRRCHERWPARCTPLSPCAPVTRRRTHTRRTRALDSEATLRVRATADAGWPDAHVHADLSRAICRPPRATRPIRPRGTRKPSGTARFVHMPDVAVSAGNSE